MKKKLENFQEILTVSKHSHSEVGFILVISLGPEGGIRSPHCLANIEFGKADEVEQLPKWSRGLPHGSFPRNSLW